MRPGIFGRLALVLAGTAALSACDLDLMDPNNPSEDAVLGDPDGIRAVAVGLQAEYGDEIVDPIYVSGLITDELGAGPSTFDTYKDADSGTDLNPTTDIAGAVWRGQYEVVEVANNLLRVVPGAGFTAGTESGILALANLHKAMAFGNLILLYERIPVVVGPRNPQPEFATRAAALAEILRLLQLARTQVETTPPSDAFRTQILAPGFDLENTIHAMTARYALVAGDLDLALAAAQRVDLGRLSVLRFSNSDPNPLWNMWYNSGNAYQLRPEQKLRLEAEPGDRRVAYWIRADTLKGANGRLDELNQFRSAPAPLAVYLPDEMRLIQAEVLARRNQLDAARALVNAVRTQTASPVDEPVAGLPPRTAAELASQAQLLEEILRQRRYELFLQGLRYSDLRRFDAPLKFPYLPYPDSECDRNPNAPC